MPKTPAVAEETHSVEAVRPSPCDQILALIDECLADVDTRPTVGPRPDNVAATRQLAGTSR